MNHDNDNLLDDPMSPTSIVRREAMLSGLQVIHNVRMPCARANGSSSRHDRSA